MLALPSQQRGVRARYGLTQAQTDAEAWTIDPHDRREAGAAAINRVLLAIGPPWSLLALIYRVPPVHWLEDRVYEQVAAHRSFLSRFWSTRPACEEPGADCE